MPAASKAARASSVRSSESMPMLTWSAFGNSVWKAATTSFSPPGTGGSARRRKLPQKYDGFSGERITRWVPRSSTRLPAAVRRARSVRKPREVTCMSGG